MNDTQADETVKLITMDQEGAHIREESRRDASSRNGCLCCLIIVTTCTAVVCIGALAFNQALVAYDQSLEVGDIMPINEHGMSSLLDN